MTKYKPGELAARQRAYDTAKTGSPMTRNEELEKAFNLGASYGVSNHKSATSYGKAARDAYNKSANQFRKEFNRLLAKDTSHD